MAFTIRRMTLEDVEDVYHIEKEGHIAPWSKQIIHDCVAIGYGCYVLVKRKKIRGFMITRVAGGACHLLNLCIAPASQGKGFGEALLVYLIELLKTDCMKIYLEVRPTNLPAQRLYEKYGFRQVDYKKHYYSDPDGSHEDALVLELLLRGVS